MSTASPKLETIPHPPAELLRAPGCISTRGLTRRYGEAVGLHPLDLDIEAGRITGLLGPNGSGKSTLLRLLLGIVPPTAGTAAVDGLPLTGDGTALRRRATYMPGEIAVYGEMRGKEHLRWLLRGRERGALERSLEVAAGFGLDVRRKVRTFSQGMKRQLFFAAALGPRVPVRILDEPTDGLDPTARREVLGRLRAEADAGVTILLSSHHLAEVEDACQRLVFLNGGRLLADEETATLHERARSILRIHWNAAASAEAPRAPGAPGTEAASGSELEPALLERLGALGATSVRSHGRLAIVHTDEEPLEYLGRLHAASDVPTPSAVDYGRLSLADLYRDLYGVEGL